MANEQTPLSVEVDIFTPGDQSPGNVVRVPTKRSPVFSALLIWNRADGQPNWRPISASGQGVPQGYADTDYVATDYY